MFNPTAQMLSAGQLSESISRLRMHRQLRLAGGLDSHVEGGGSPSSTFRTPLLPLLRARFGDCGPGLMRFGSGDVNDALSNTTYNVANATANTSFAVSGTGAGQISSLAWSNPIRQKSLYGAGVYTTSATAASCSCAPTASSIPNCIGVRIIFEFAATGSSFRWRQNSTTETGSTSTTISSDSGVGTNAAAYDGVAFTQNKLYSIFRPYYGSRGTLGLTIDSMVGDIRIYAVEFVTSVPGVTLMNLGIGGTKAADWAQLDDTRCREWASLLEPDLFMVNAGTNDRTIDTPERFSRSLDTIVSRIQNCPITNVLLVRPADTSDTASTNLVNYASVIASIASSRRCGYIDDRTALGAYAAANAASYMSADGIHPLLAGNVVRANAYMSRILSYAQLATYVP